MMLDGEFSSSDYKEMKVEIEVKNLNWNTDNRFNFFPPKSAIDTTLNMKYSDLVKIYTGLQSSDIKIKKKYTVVFFWTNVLEKISCDAISQVYNNIDLNKMTDSIEVITFNNDNSFIE
ncbi:MAG: hypothetical protein IT239_06210 [Bacteroidia bacterium]|nr:hypothetical protein [Bacteroidia bacterium]